MAATIALVIYGSQRVNCVEMRERLAMERAKSICESSQRGTGITDKLALGDILWSIQQQPLGQRGDIASLISEEDQVERVGLVCHDGVVCLWVSMLMTAANDLVRFYN